jgi:hypothetical protein
MRGLGVWIGLGLSGSNTVNPQKANSTPATPKATDSASTP